MSEPTHVPLTGMRGMLADRMLKSLHDAAQLTHHAECGVDRLNAVKRALAQAGQRFSVEDLILHAVVKTLVRHPALNGTVVGREILLRPTIDLSVAISLPDNLLVAPTMFDVGSSTLSERAALRKDLVERANARKLSVREMTEGSFTVSNLGLSRVRFFTPILNPPQIAILGIGETREAVAFDADGVPRRRSLMGLSLTFDHRAVNGGPAAGFMTDLCVCIESFSEKIALQ